MTTPSESSLSSAVVATSPLWKTGIVPRSVLNATRLVLSARVGGVPCTGREFLRGPTASSTTAVDDKPRVCRVALFLRLSHVRVLLAVPGSLLYTSGLTLAKRADLRRLFCLSTLPRTGARSPLGSPPWGVCGVRVGVPWSPASCAKAATLRARPV